MEGTFDVLQDHLASILHPPRTWSIDKCWSSWLLVWSCTAWCWRMSVMIKSMAKLGLHGPFDWALACTVRVWRLSQYVFANPWLWCSWINPRRSTWALVDSQRKQIVFMFTGWGGKSVYCSNSNFTIIVWTILFECLKCSRTYLCVKNILK